MSYNIQNMQPSFLQTPDERQMGMFLHLSQLANVILFPVGIVLPIVLWQTQKEKMPALDAHGKMVIELDDLSDYLRDHKFSAYLCCGRDLIDRDRRIVGDNLSDHWRH